MGLEINPVEMPDAGVYGVKLVNPLGEDASEGKITVRKVFQPPTFSQKFTDLQQVTGLYHCNGNRTLDCQMLNGS